MKIKKLGGKWVLADGGKVLFTSSSEEIVEIYAESIGVDVKKPAKQKRGKAKK